ncbi:MAG: gamma carbonic anhydrase family protein [Methylocella sp.]
MPFYALDGYAPELPEDDRFWIAPDAHVIGKVRLGVDVSIWFGAVLRGDNEEIFVGAGSNIQDNSVLHTDPGCPLTIGKNCTIGHRAILHGCIIGDSCLIGMGATVLNRVNIGNNCLVGANALLTEDRVYADNSLIVGSPAKIIRTLDEGAVLRLRESAARYVANWRRYAKGLALL